MPGSSQAREARADSLLLPAPGIISWTPPARPLRKSTFQSIDLVSKALRVLNGGGRLAVGEKENKDKTIRHFSLDDVAALLSLGNETVSPWGVCSRQRKGPRALPSFTGFLLIEELPCARHPSWVLGTEKCTACPPYTWELARQPTEESTESTALQGL